MKKPTRRRPKLRLTAVEIRQIQQAVAILEGKYGEEAKELLRRLAARLKHAQSAALTHQPEYAASSTCPFVGT